MDHIPAPTSQLVWPKIGIPYVCSSRLTYDDLGFLGYPLRVGVDFDRACMHDQISSAPFAPFLQSWLWFGVLGETLGVGSRMHVPQLVANFQSFIKTAEDGQRILTTKSLRGAVRKRRHNIPFALTKDTFLSKFDQALLVATQAVNVVLETHSSKKHAAAATSISDLDEVHLILLSVQVLVESLRSYRGFLFTMSAHQTLPRAPTLHHRPDLINILLQEAGWCESQILSLDADIQIRFFLGSTFKYGHCVDDDYNAMERQGVPFGTRNMDTVHAHPDCLCEKVEILETTVIDITQRGMVPLVTYGEIFGGAWQVDLKELDVTSSAGTPTFVAFSHVRNQGLGHSSAHSLPHCQLALLQKLANSPNGSSKGLTPFYIDTMCIPFQEDAKNESLNNLPWIYANALTVIVLDPSLRTAAVGSDADALVRIRYSLWKTRLWTLQEGFLAKKLVFQFANGAYDLDTLLDRFRSEAALSILSRSLETWQPHINNELLLARIQGLDADMKLVTDLDKIAGPDTTTHLKSILRLCYLNMSRYRFFIGEEERTQCLLAYQALEEVYFEPQSQEIESEETIHDRLRRMYRLAKTRGVK